MKNLEIINNLNINKIKGFLELEKKSHSIYLVGGIVRDFYLKKDSKDIDIVVCGLYYENIIEILSKYGEIIEVGKLFGILKYIPTGWEGEPIDIAIPRKDIKNGDGHQGFSIEVDPFLMIDTEMNRRDFRFNSIAIKLDGTIIDPFNGLQDIENKIIRATSNQSFSDDPLRMLRAIQFASRFNFEIEENTWKMIQQNCSDIKTITGERVHEELNKIYFKGNINKGLKLFYNSGLYKQLFPNVEYLIPNPDNIYSISDFYYLICGDAENYKNILKGDNNIYKGIKAIEKCLEKHEKILMRYDIRQILFDAYQISPSIFESTLLNNYFNNIIQEFKNNHLPKKITELDITGEDLMKQGFKGKEIGDRQKFLLMEIFKGNRQNFKKELLYL